MAQGSHASAPGQRLGSGQGRIDLAATENPYFYRFALGGAKATMVSDGPLAVGPLEPHFENITPAEMTAILDANFARKDQMVLEQNVLVLDIGGRIVLFDTGMGDLDGFGPTCGQLMRTLAQAQIDPAGIDAVVLSHAHVDHVSGITTADGTRNFPNAQYYINEQDFAFWTDPDRPLDLSTRAARHNLLPNRDRIVFIKDGEEFLPGITALLAPGHSVGHMMFMLQSGGRQLCLTNDLAHHYAIMLEKPLVEFHADTDAKQSAQSRKKALTMLAEDKVLMMGFHFPWPGIGHVVKFGDGFRFVPAAIENIPLP